MPKVKPKTQRRAAADTEQMAAVDAALAAVELLRARAEDCAKQTRCAYLSRANNARMMRTIDACIGTAADATEAIDAITALLVAAGLADDRRAAALREHHAAAAVAIDACHRSHDVAKRWCAERLAAFDSGRFADAKATVDALKDAGHYAAGTAPTVADITHAVGAFNSDELDAMLRLPSVELNYRLLQAWGHIQ